MRLQELCMFIFGLSLFGSGVVLSFVRLPWTVPFACIACGHALILRSGM